MELKGEIVEDKALQERILDDERAVQELLEGAGRTDDPVLWDLLLQVRELRTVDVPAPSPRLRALLASLPVDSVLTAVSTAQLRYFATVNRKVESSSA